VKRILTLSFVLVSFVVVGCGDGAATPKPKNPDGNPGLKPDRAPTTNQQKPPSGAVKE
jgi:hypothetical protein